MENMMLIDPNDDYFTSYKLFVVDYVKVNVKQDKIARLLSTHTELIMSQVKISYLTLEGLH